MSEFYIEVFQYSTQVMTENYRFLRLILNQVKQTIDNRSDNFKSKRKIVVRNLLYLVISFLRETSKSKVIGEIPYCDIIIQKEITYLDHYLHDPDILDSVVSLDKGETAENRAGKRGAKDLFKTILLCIKHSIKKRITYDFYQFLMQYFHLDRLIELLRRAGH